MSDLVRMEGIDKRFPGVHALRGVNFDLRAGEVHALMGENGAGKSTLMKILSGVYQPSGGRILVDGAEATLPGPKAAQDLGICIIHQELALMRDLTAAQNIWIGREPRLSLGRIDEARLNADAAAIFADMRSAIDPRAEVGTLSIARQQMVEIAKALSYRSRVLIMDEPTAALTDAEIGELFAIIRKLRADGVGIVYISHKMDEIKRIADRITVMRDGAYGRCGGHADVHHHLDDGRARDCGRDRLHPRPVGRADRAGGAGPDARARGPRCQLPAAPGRDPGLCRPHGRGPDRDRARHLWRRAG